MLSPKCYLGNLHLRKGYSSYLSHSVLLLKHVIYTAKKTYYLEQTCPSDQNEQFYLKGICHAFAFTFHAISADTHC